MADNDIELDVHRAMCAAGWIMFLLIQKNIVLLVILAVHRRKNAIYRIPEDANVFGAGQQPGIIDDWSLAGRIQRVLANETEYVPYFLALLIFMFCGVNLTASSNPHYFARVLVYGIIFIIGRYLHTAGYLFRNTYARILGFLITVILLFILTIDHVYYMTKGLHN
jgi:uncharacterized membrane protein YecN with MAPEG domain